MDKEEKVDLLREAQEKLFEAIELIEVAVGDNANVQAYLIDHLKIFASEGHGFLSGDLNIDKVIENLWEGESDDEER